MDIKLSKPKSETEKTTDNSSLKNMKLENNHMNKKFELNFDNLPHNIKRRLEKALKIKHSQLLISNKEFDNQKNIKEDNACIYKSIRTEDTQKNHRKTFSQNPEINLIDHNKITDILKDENISIYEKIKNFDIQFERNIDDIHKLKDENTKFIEKFNKFYINGNYVKFEPFKNKSKSSKKDFIKNYIEKSIFDEIITAYEKKGYKIPNLLKKTIFDMSPMLVDLHKIKEFYKIPERLEDKKFFKDIKNMIKLNRNLNDSGRTNLKEIVFFCENDFILNKQNNLLTDIDDLKKENKDNYNINLKLKEYIQVKADELKDILIRKKFNFQEEIENIDPNCDLIFPKMKNNELIQGENPIKLKQKSKTKKINSKENVNNDYVFNENNNKLNLEKAKSKDKIKTEDMNNLKINSLLNKINLIEIIKKSKSNDVKDNEKSYDKNTESEEKISPIAVRLDGNKTKCFKTLGSFKKKNKCSNDNIFEIKLNDMTKSENSNIFDNKSISMKKNELRNKIENIESKSKKSSNNPESIIENSFNDNLYKIQNFQILNNIKKNFRNLENKNILQTDTGQNKNNDFYLTKNTSFISNKKKLNILNNNHDPNLKDFNHKNKYLTESLILKKKISNNNSIENNLNTKNKKNFKDSENIELSNNCNTNIISSSKRITNADSRNLSSQFSYTINNNFQITNNVSVSDFTTKINNDITNVLKFSNDNNSELKKNNTYANYINSANNSNFAIPKGFKKSSMNMIGKKINPIKLMDMKQLEKLKSSDSSKDLLKFNLNENKNDKLENNIISKEKNRHNSENFNIKNNLTNQLNDSNLNSTMKNLKKINTLNKTEDNNLICFKDLSQEKKLLSKSELSKDQSELTYDKENNINNEINFKENYLENLYNKVANKNFSNLKNDIEKYVKLFANKNLEKDITNMNTK